ncbi:hypothetical protein [Tahibacter amnicola]|uniref:Uncharacterized protein n=1 Tax=Tahibacter amnicola TaxID=2976241 RepID=A0ABY6BJ30_9GAMM|nr:hypothetical protein [Tahibacter amnicola]UXI69767.1 hypothetical protein N4264_09090 [Tahibacter amnicola]
MTVHWFEDVVGNVVILDYAKYPDSEHYWLHRTTQPELTEDECVRFEEAATAGDVSRVATIISALPDDRCGFQVACSSLSRDDLAAVFLEFEDEPSAATRIARCEERQPWF